MHKHPECSIITIWRGNGRFAGRPIDTHTQLPTLADVVAKNVLPLLALWIRIDACSDVQSGARRMKGSVD
jgi:hypothetical protein